MNLQTNPVPGRQGWHLGTVVHSGAESRCALTHVETGEACWVYGETPEKRTEAAQREIDGIYERRLALMVDLIEQGDHYGPNCRLLIPSGDADNPDA